MSKTDHRLFRDETGNVKDMLTPVEGISYRESPLDFFILLARYKFAARFLKKHHRVLDAGCGRGAGSVMMTRFAGEVVGGDFDQDLVNANGEEYKDVPNLSFDRIDLLDISGKEAAFDVVVSMDVIEHFVEQDTETVASNYARLLKDDGFAVIGTPNVASRPYASQRRLDTHPFEFTPQQFEDLLNRHFKQVFLFSMTDEVVSTSFPQLSWYLMALCVK